MIHRATIHFLQVSAERRIDLFIFMVFFQITQICLSFFTQQTPDLDARHIGVGRGRGRGGGGVGK